MMPKIHTLLKCRRGDAYETIEKQTFIRSDYQPKNEMKGVLKNGRNETRCGQDRSGTGNDPVG